MNFNEFLAHAKKVDCLNLSTLAEEVGSHMVLHPDTCMRVIEKALAPVECPEDIRWDFLSASLNEGDALDMAVVVATSPWCLKLLGTLDEVKDDSGKGFCLAILNGLDVEEKFYNYFDFEDYWHKNGGDTITTSYGVYMLNMKEITLRIKELVSC
jgi:hypothetical protein